MEIPNTVDKVSGSAGRIRFSFEFSLFVVIIAQNKAEQETRHDDVSQTKHREMSGSHIGVNAVIKQTCSEKNAIKNESTFETKI